jgi:hypothetical protein
LEEIVFLKRSFRKIEGVEHYVARLDESSILRMLSYKKSKTLSDADHQCITLSQALREYVYYGREVYEARRAMYTEFLMSENITNGYFVSKPYEYWVEKIRDGTFSAWELDTVPTFLQLE